MAETLKLELVAPERLLLSQQVEMVIVPGTEGYFGVLPKHAPVISTLRPGVIDVYEGGAISQRVFVTGGFAEVNAAGVTVLVDEALPASDVTKEMAAARKAAAEDAAASATTDDARRRAAAALKVAEAMAALAA
ncbi:MAG: ATP synthase F1 subunit epsilon [Rhodospirillaceae bacterium]|nr:ATP synthase F1 subunit epsilon [Rhodospirillaceae bacterium]